MTRYCKEERTKVYNLYLEYFYHPTQESYRNYIRAEQAFKNRFHKRFSPLYLIDEYDVYGITWTCKEEKLFKPMTNSIFWKNVTVNKTINYDNN